MLDKKAFLIIIKITVLFITNSDNPLHPLFWMYISLSKEDNEIVVKYFVWHIAWFGCLFYCLQVLYRFYFLRFPLLFHIRHCSLICTTLFHLCHHFFLVLYFFVSCIQHIVLAIEIDWILIRDVFFVASILILSKVASFHHEFTHFLYQKI